MPPEKIKHPSIECAKNGPYLVRNVDTLMTSRGDAIAAAIAYPGPALVEVASDPELI